MLALPEVGVRGQLRDQIQLLVQIVLVLIQLLFARHWHCLHAIDPWTERLLGRTFVVPNDIRLEHSPGSDTPLIPSVLRKGLKDRNLVLNVHAGRVLVSLQRWRLVVTAHD